ncbi:MULTISPECIES: hypothetical protein [unclassified Nocardia]|uniref:hypothetical protein n=1 Tax=unclassified Nocardia TaxID=2637762 RepID=UPI001CE46568|nr:MULTISPECIES: hypothetical protein [unclassified Nocardia]
MIARPIFAAGSRFGDYVSAIGDLPSGVAGRQAFLVSGSSASAVGGGTRAARCVRHRNHRRACPSAPEKLPLKMQETQLVSTMSGCPVFAVRRRIRAIRVCPDRWELPEMCCEKGRMNHGSRVVPSHSIVSGIFPMLCVRINRGVMIFWSQLHRRSGHHIPTEVGEVEMAQETAETGREDMSGIRDIEMLRMQVEDARLEAQSARQSAQQAQNLARQAQQQARQVQHQASMAQSEANQANQQAQQARQQAIQAQNQAQQAQNEADRAQNQAQQAQNEANQSQQRAQSAQDQADQANQLAQQADDQATRAQDRASQGEMQLSQMRHQTRMAAR